MLEDIEKVMPEAALWDEVISNWFPNADRDEIEEELVSLIKD